ncbi:TetR/AcrR family transcriptional regulator [Streptomyces doebereineriae]|uniref:TetR/AcrR family transcriptional regulator n=1 Tax=Streptomyces doebereineriae TaxID=3075528 RepID=A0ABU2V388_9ACTN|nr:TetR/AcrR family transcriptional regulator [Streptomyces sp. DSM 41640]MDT0479427.1 TetR/AcrR family transcriptional regulator [Streptomyces sp. DSM 41640]
MARTKSFEPAYALRKALFEFWRNGYERTSTDVLMAAMGIGKRSLYDTFGSKHDLYLRTLTTYIEHAEESHAQAVEAAPGKGLVGVRALLRSHVALPGCPAGCFAVNAATERPDDPDVHAAVCGYFTRSAERIAWLLRQEERWATVRPQQLDRAAQAVHNGWLGLRVQARLGASEPELDAAADDLLSSVR